MNTITITPQDIARTFTLIARHDTHYFINHELPDYLDSLSQTGTTRFRNYFNSLRSGEYIPKDSYSDTETEYVYLTIGQFSGQYVTFEDLTFLDDLIGEQYTSIQVHKGDLVITRSGTVGVVHIFEPPDEKIYIPSHHLAIVGVKADEDYLRDYLRLLLQSEFTRKYFWAFASGKSQKEISNWSIKSIPIPQCDNPGEVASRCKGIEAEIQVLETELTKKHEAKERVLYEAISR